MAQTGKLGAADSLLGNLLPAFAGADDALPSTDPRTGVLGTSDALLAQVILDLDGPDNPKVYNLSATNVLVLTQLADSGPALVGHPSPDWVLGGHDAQVGDTGLGYSGPPDSPPDPGTRSGKLGFALGSLLIGLSGADLPKVFHVSATTTIVITQTAESGPALVGHPSPRWVLGGQDSYLGNVEPAFAGPSDPRPTTGTLTGKLGSPDSFLAGMRLALGETEGDSSAKTWTVSATSSLTLSSTAALTNFSRCVSGLSTIVFSTIAGAGVARPVAGASTLTLSDLAGTKAVRPVQAESTITLSAEAALYPWVITEVGAESVLDLSVVATSRYSRFWPVAESVIELSQFAEQTERNVINVLAASSLDLGVDATGRHTHFRPSAQSTVGLSVDATGRHAHFRPTAGSVIDLTVASTGRHAHFRPSALTTIVLTQTGQGFMSATANVSAESTIELTDAATGRYGYLRLDALSTIEVSDSASAKGIYLRDGESVLQTITEDYDSELDEIVTTIVGLQDAATTAITTSRAGRTVIPLTQNAGVVRIKTTAISVSGESVLELVDQSWKNEIGEAISSLTLSQTAVGFRSNPTGSVIHLTDAAGVSVVRKRSASSVLELKQSVTFTLVRPDVTYQYRPFIGEGPTEAPTPPPATLPGF